MAIKLMYIANEPRIAHIAETNGVDRIFVDLEVRNKAKRQKNIDSVKSHHCLNDINKIKDTLTTAELLVRSNAMYEGSQKEINEIVERGADIVMLTNHGRFLAFRGERTFDSFPRQQVSILIPDSTTAVTSDGLRWPLDNFHARLWWNATLNEALKENFTLRTTGWILLFQTYETKG